MKFGLVFIGAWLTETDAGIGDGRLLSRAVTSYQSCDAHLGELELDNGTKFCEHGACKIQKCAEGYHRTKTDKWQAAKAKCIKNSKGLKWNKKLFRCRTCEDMNPLADHPDFEVNCGYQSIARGTYSLKRCTFQCKNGGNIMPMNVQKVVNVRCGCNIWEKDRKCHWRAKGKTYDIDNSLNFRNWKCSSTNTVKPTKTPNTRTTTRPETAGPTTISPIQTGNRIPKGLQCSKTPAMMRNMDSDRIIGGVEAIKGSWPWIVRLIINHGTVCGGTILDDRTILTAGHCCDGARKIIAVTGDHSRFEDETTQRMHQVKTIINHPEYRMKGKESPKNDICILKTLRSLNLKYDQAVAPACLPNRGQIIPEGTVCWTAGWGKTRTSGWQISRVLNEVDLKIFDDATCKKTDIGDDFVPEQMVCAGWEQGKKDGCQGDSGGPLMCAINDQPVLIGATSWGWGCAQANKPGVWADVSNYIDWIISHAE